jgi:hypothetical protein
MHRTGSCHCHAVAFTVADVPGAAPVGDPGPGQAVACHCTQCRRWSGHFWAATAVPLARFTLGRQDGLTWFASSAGVRRGFCRDCGSSLFWLRDGTDAIEIAAGAFDAPTGLLLGRHDHVPDAGDYYGPEGPPPPPGPAPGRLDGACLCGACRFSLPGPAGPVTACHCHQCRRISGHCSASFDAREDAVTWHDRDSLRTYATPGGSLRGFCGMCGSSLWFRAADGAFSVEAGSIGGPTGGRLAVHIFTAEAGDYYRIDDGLPKAPGPG